MKKLCLTGTVFALMLFANNVLLAQNVDQLKLMKQFIGKWEASTGKDTVQVWDFKLYGEQSFFVEITQIIKGKTIPVSFNSTSYDPKAGKFYGYSLMANGNYGTWIGSFASETKFYGNMVQNFNPQLVWGRLENTIKNPREWTWTGYNNEGVKFLEFNFVKVK
jgi:hypothetical protein